MIRTRLLVLLSPASDPGAPGAALTETVARLRSDGHSVSEGRLEGRDVLVVEYVEGGPDPAAALSRLGAVERVVPLDRPYREVARPSPSGAADAPRAVRIRDAVVGGARPALVAGPCAVEDEKTLFEIAASVRAAGASILRGGAVKPRTSPYAFQGLGRVGYERLGRVGREVGIAVVSEVVDERTLGYAEATVDMVQVGARNMQNFELLKRVGRSGKPVLLKRGMSATLDEWLLAAEYVASEGNRDIVLCERGIRTFSTHSRYTLDLSVIPALRTVSDLPVIADPSHATGRRDRVPAMARAAIAAGAHGVMVDVHACPERARCDGPQALTVREFDGLASEIAAISEAVASSRETVG